MGFWHTGYLEFHERTGLDLVSYAAPPRFTCVVCGAEFPAADALRMHRFETHAATQPLLLIRGAAVGNAPYKVTKTLNPAEITLRHSETAFVDERRIDVNHVPIILSRKRTARVILELRGNGIRVKFDLRFRIASGKDLRGIETAFNRLVGTGELTAVRIESFVTDAERFETASAYMDGIAQYLYGVRAKERSDTSLEYERYLEKFEQAADELQYFDRPLARYIRAIIAFHQNHFYNAARLAGPGELRLAARRCLTLLQEGDVESLETYVPPGDLTDFETLQVIRWTCIPAAFLECHVAEMERFCRLTSGVADRDRVKAKLLLGEHYLTVGDYRAARRIANELRPLALFENWAAAALLRCRTET